MSVCARAAAQPLALATQPPRRAMSCCGPAKPAGAKPAVAAAAGCAQLAPPPPSAPPLADGAASPRLTSQLLPALSPNPCHPSALPCCSAGPATTGILMGDNQAVYASVQNYYGEASVGRSQCTKLLN